jgi:Glycosyl transferases group 1
LEKKLNILFLSQVTVTSLEDRTIYTDLISEFIDHGHNVTVISAYERRNITSDSNPKKFKLIKIKTPNLQKTTKIEKAIGHIAFDFQLLFTIKKHLKESKFDICLYFSPPITLTRTLFYVKKKYNTFNYLWLKDIFPQNAVDMGMMNENSIIHKYFRQIEKKYYQLSDKIGVMSPANMDYIISKNTDILCQKKIEVCPNCIKLNSQTGVIQNSDYTDKVKLIYGGNLGIPQAISFVIQILSHYLNHPKVEFTIIGSGTEYTKLKKWIEVNLPGNVKLISHLPKSEYDQKVMDADIGLIFLSYKFTIPNFPSRLLTYLENKKPVLCFTDIHTDIGKIAKENHFGDWAPSDDVQKSIRLIDHYLLKTKQELSSMGENGFSFLIDNYTSLHAYNNIISAYNKSVK